MDQWNDLVDKGKDPKNFKKGADKLGANFSTSNGAATEKEKVVESATITHTKDGFVVKTESKKQEEENEDRIFMGGIPFTMLEEEVKQMCESFGKLRSFSWLKDHQNPSNNKGFCFFEYEDERAAEKAIKALNNLEIADKRLKV